MLGTPETLVLERVSIPLLVFVLLIRYKFREILILIILLLTCQQLRESTGVPLLGLPRVKKIEISRDMVVVAVGGSDGLSLLRCDDPTH
jgi:hypothetical protein